MPRPLPPPLEFPYPPCSICGTECELHDNSFYCIACDAGWPTEGAPEGYWWVNDETEQCPSTYRPWKAQEYAYLGLLCETVHRCILEAGHLDAGRGADKHMHPGWADGWTDKDAEAES